MRCLRTRIIQKPSEFHVGHLVKVLIQVTFH